MKYSFISYTGASADSTVVLLKSGEVREVRRGSATGRAITDPATWASFEAWMNNLSDGEITVYTNNGEMVETISVPLKPAPTLDVKVVAAAPALVVAVVDKVAAGNKYTEDEIQNHIRGYLDAIDLAKGKPAKVAACTVLMNYLLLPEVLDFAHDYPKMQATIVGKMKELSLDPDVSPEFVAKANSVIAAYMVVRAPSAAAPAAAPVPAMSKDQYQTTIRPIIANLRKFVAATSAPQTEQAPFYKEEFVAYVSRPEFIALYKADAEERLDIRAFLRWLVHKDAPSAPVSIAVAKILMMIPM